MSSTAEDLLIRHRLTVNDYHRMGEAGILHEDSRVELIEGEIIDMAPIGSLHAGTVRHLSRLLEQLATMRSFLPRTHLSSTATRSLGPTSRCCVRALTFISARIRCRRMYY